MCLQVAGAFLGKSLLFGYAVTYSELADVGSVRHSFLATFL